MIKILYIVTLFCLFFSCNGCFLLISRPVLRVVSIRNDTSNEIIVATDTKSIRIEANKYADTAVREDLLFIFNDGSVLSFTPDDDEYDSFAFTQESIFSNTILLTYKIKITNDGVFIVDSSGCLIAIKK